MSRRLGSSILLVAVAVLVCGGSSIRSEPQLPLSGQGQTQLEKQVEKSANEIAAKAGRFLGSLNSAEQEAFRRWLLAARSWKKEQSHGAAALLAEGVLFDCLGRLKWVDPGFRYGLGVDKRFNDLGMPDRPRAAAQLFDEALKVDSALLEARFRSARIRVQGGGSAVTDLERLATSGTDPLIAYLAAVSRGAASQQRGDGATAALWYERAMTIRGRSTAAIVGLGALRPAIALKLDDLDPADPYYTYPCHVLTPGVAAELARRIAQVPK